jgi:hypothetical protein
MIMHRTSIIVSSFTRASTLVSLENRDGYMFRVIMRTSEMRTPIKNEVATATTSENLAVLG